MQYHPQLILKHHPYMINMIYMIHIAADDALHVTTECVDQHGNPDPDAQVDATDENTITQANDDDDMEHGHAMNMTSSRTLDELYMMMMEAEEKATQQQQQHQHKHHKQTNHIPSQRPHTTLGRPDFLSLFTSIQSGERSVSEEVRSVFCWCLCMWSHVNGYRCAFSCTSSESGIY